ncbi:MAG: MiaB/RimO family radical SAM methylthiotransferase [Patescibacteria group bacterium]|nr:MiaB/RimO family radical SAM methylthiotransferase [Patescibacteria group bacterium]
MTKTVSSITPKTFLTKSLGCRVNQAEMEAISLQLIAYGLQQDGLQTTDYCLQQPDLVLLNTCAVTTKAERETRKEVRKLRRLYPKSFLVVLGCGPSAKIKYPEADLLIKNEGKNNTIDILKKLLNITVETPRRGVSRKLLSRYSTYTQSGRKFIKIQEGCNKFCSFCLTAYLRGPLKSIPTKEIIEEINFWKKKGIKEIILTGINIALYQPSITDLLNTILEKTQVERITLSSLYPEMLTPNFINLVIENPRISRVFHLSIQSGSPTALVRMNRKIDMNTLIEQLLYLKKKIPQFTYRADFITGFPEETEKEFQETLDFIQKAKISFVHVFPFSARKGTVAYTNIKNNKWQDLSMQVKKEREKRILEVVKEVRREEAMNLVNQKTNCLIVKLLNCYLVEGITENGWPLLVQNAKLKVKNLKGQIVSVKITDFKNDQLFGEILSFPTNSLKTSGTTTEPSSC